MDHDALGSRCFQKGDHLGALEHFNTAIKSSSPKLVPAILNKRSLVYIKLEKFQQALRDGREIIKRVPEMAMGYLRCGQVVQLMGQRDKALEILEHGLHKVPVGNDGDRKILSKHYEALRRQFHAHNCLDPLTKLPQDIVLHIWDLLDPKSRCRCLSVSMDWKKSLESYPPLWQDLQISNNISVTALTAWLRRAEHGGYNLRSATISSKDFNGQCRNHIKRVQRRSKLRHLKLLVPSGYGRIPAMLPVPSQYLKTLVVSEGSQVNISTVKQIMVDYTHLEHVEFHAVTGRDSPDSWPAMPNLQFIILNSHSGRDGKALGWHDLIKASPNTKSATLKHWQYETVLGVVDMARWTKLTYLDITNTILSFMPIFPSTLIHLETDEIIINLGTFNRDEKAYFQLPKLEYLGVNNSELFALVNDIANPALVSGSLKTLDTGAQDITIETRGRNSWLQTLPAPSAALKTISLYKQMELPENVIIAVLRQYPNLKMVDLRFTSVTGSTLRELFERENKPDFIQLEGCVDCYHDAIEAAREAGIEVSHELAPRKKTYNGKRHPTYPRLLHY